MHEMDTLKQVEYVLPQVSSIYIGDYILLIVFKEGMQASATDLLQDDCICCRWSSGF